MTQNYAYWRRPIPAEMLSAEDVACLRRVRVMGPDKAQRRVRRMGVHAAYIAMVFLTALTAFALGASSAAIAFPIFALTALLVGFSVHTRHADPLLHLARQRPHLIERIELRRMDGEGQRCFVTVTGLAEHAVTAPADAATVFAELFRLMQVHARGRLFESTWLGNDRPREDPRSVLEQPNPKGEHHD